MAQRNTTIRDRHRHHIARTKPPCGICRDPIDYTLRFDTNAAGKRIPHPLSFTVDHVMPLNKGGTDTLDNKQAAHWLCNRLKSDRTDGGIGTTNEGPRTFITPRHW